MKHSAGEYVRYEQDRAVHTNTVEGYFSVFKRGMKGTYQHCAEKHLHRYLAEFDFRQITSSHSRARSRALKCGDGGETALEMRRRALWVRSGR